MQNSIYIHASIERHIFCPISSMRECAHQIFQSSLLTLNSVTSPNQTCPFFQIVSFCLSLTNHTCSLFMFLGSTETLSSEAFPSKRYVNFTHKPRTLSKWTLIQEEINVDTEGEYELSVLIDVSRCPTKN